MGRGGAIPGQLHRRGGAGAPMTLGERSRPGAPVERDVPSSRDPLRYLLVQARNAGDPARDDEHRCFAERLGVQRDAVRCVSIFRDPLTLDLIEGVDAELVGGSGAPA